MLIGIAWAGDVFAVLGSYILTGGETRGWWLFLIADFSLIGIQIYHHTWNQVVLFLIFIAISIRGLIKSGQLCKSKLLKTT